MHILSGQIPDIWFLLSGIRKNHYPMTLLVLSKPWGQNTYLHSIVWKFKGVFRGKPIDFGNCSIMQTKAWWLKLKSLIWFQNELNNQSALYFSQPGFYKWYARHVMFPVKFMLPERSKTIMARRPPFFIMVISHQRTIIKLKKIIMIFPLFYIIDIA